MTGFRIVWALASCRSARGCRASWVSTFRYTFIGGSFAFFLIRCFSSLCFLIPATCGSRSLSPIVPRSVHRLTFVPVSRVALDGAGGGRSGRCSELGEAVTVLSSSTRTSHVRGGRAPATGGGTITLCLSACVSPVSPGLSAGKCFTRVRWWSL